MAEFKINDVALCAEDSAVDPIVICADEPKTIRELYKEYINRSEEAWSDYEWGVREICLYSADTEENIKKRKIVISFLRSLMEEGHKKATALYMLLVAYTMQWETAQWEPAGLLDDEFAIRSLFQNDACGTYKKLVEEESRGCIEQEFVDFLENVPLLLATEYAMKEMQVEKGCNINDDDE